RENAAPYDVLLGLLGEEVLRQRGVDWQTQPGSPGPVAGCLWFAQTRHNVCDQTPGAGFKQYWTSNGLQFDGQSGASAAESLALFGLPISEPFNETINGQSWQVQWFERARFEWHPSNAAPYRVLLGRLGAEFQPPPEPRPATALFASQDSPTDVLASFYNAINRREFGRAYDYWESPPTNFTDFAQGYANTTRVQLIVQPPTFIDAGAGNLHAAIPTFLVATQSDGSQQYFAGCYTVHKANIQTDVWHLAQAQITPVDAGTSIPEILTQACAAYGVPPSAQTSYADPTTPVNLLASFYNAIDRGEYGRAYGYWENPPSSYDVFAQGYADTANVQLLVQLPVFVNTRTSDAYASIPAVLIATMRDGSQQRFTGCYTTHKVNIQPDVWHLTSATVTLIRDKYNIPLGLAQACPAQ
ncbi:MAG: hypothetical protein H7Z42_08165, partial [Roseiflexaceae bacterium]|nr:hypothetical protein [Roseiflexaceae bacterium]